MVYSSFAHTNEREPADVVLNTTTMMEKASLCVSDDGRTRPLLPAALVQWHLSPSPSSSDHHSPWLLLLMLLLPQTPAGAPGSVVWVNHFGSKHPKGFGWRDARPQFAWGAIEVFSNHYPECLKTMVIVDPPSIFFGLWRVLKPMLPTKTQQKGQFIHSDADNSKLLVEMMGQELADYVTQLMKKDAVA